MNKKKQKQAHRKHPLKITVADYLKAVKKADRDIQMSQQSGFQTTDRVHKNKKAYDRKQNKKCIDLNE